MMSEASVEVVTGTALPRIRVAFRTYDEPPGEEPEFDTRDYQWDGASFIETESSS